jgi:DOPA 4,5-dioxygenase
MTKRGAAAYNRSIAIPPHQNRAIARKMSEIQPVSSIANYHAHIYYDGEKTRHVAETLRKQIAERFRVRIGAWHDEPVGPHIRAMFQVAFDVDVFPRLVPWLMLNRAGLSILVHPNTDNPHDDHLFHALWLGEPLAVDASMLEKSVKAEGGTISVVIPNTEPKLPA